MPPVRVRAVLLDISELITSARGHRSYRDLERESAKTPNPISYARWQQLATLRPKNFPDPSTIRGVAATLGVPEQVVVLAAAESFGLDVHMQRIALADLLPPSAANLTDRQLLAVLAVIRTFLDPGLPDPADDVDEFVLPDVTAPEPPHEPSAAQRAARQRRAGHEA